MSKELTRWGAGVKTIRVNALAVCLLTLAVSFVRPSESTAAELLLFGGTSHKDFLGCLTCSQVLPDSVWNSVGQFGSSVGSHSIWNRVGSYGNPFSAVSPWNQFTSTAPVVVDREGNFYGYFSRNKLHRKRTSIDFLVFILDNYEWVREHLDEVRDALVSSRVPESHSSPPPTLDFQEMLKYPPHTRSLLLSGWLRTNQAWMDSQSPPASRRATPAPTAPSAPSGELVVEGAENIDREHASEVLRANDYSGNYSLREPIVVSPRNEEPEAPPKPSAFIVLKDGSHVEGKLQKYENGMAYVLVPNESHTKETLTTLPRSLVDEEATAEAQR